MLKNVLLEAVEAGAKVIQYYFNTKNLQISNKEGAYNPVTEADTASEKAIFEVIRKHYPTHFILSEESGEMHQESEYKWIIDPIDGTVNFAQGIPVCCVSIAVEKNGEIIMGAVFNPFMNELYFAEKGKGATLNGESIKVTQKADLNKACIATGFPYNYVESENDPLTSIGKFIKSGISVRRLGSAALDLCWVAAGRLDAYYEHKIHSWDGAAGYIIVKEAGGKVTDFANNEYSVYQPSIVASNTILHDAMLTKIHQ